MTVPPRDRLSDAEKDALLLEQAALIERLAARIDLLILDDWAMSELTAAQRRDLMEIVDDRHDRGSILLASQIPLTSWHRAIGDATYADAILDRIVHAAHRIELQGDSLRKSVRNSTSPAGGAMEQPASHLKQTTLD